MAGSPLRLGVALARIVIIAMLAAGGSLPGLVRALGVSSHVCTCASGGSHSACPVCNPRHGGHARSEHPAADGVPCGEKRVAIGAGAEATLPPAPALSRLPPFVRVPAPLDGPKAPAFQSVEPPTPPPRSLPV